MIIIRNLRRLQQHLTDAGIDNQVGLGADSVGGSTSSATQVQEWFNTNPEFLEYQKQHGIRSVVLNHQHDAVITFEDDAHEAMYRLGEFEAIEKTEVRVDWDPIMDSLRKHFQKHMSERIYDHRQWQGDWETIYGPSPDKSLPPSIGPSWPSQRHILEEEIFRKVHDLFTDDSIDRDDE